MIKRKIIKNTIVVLTLLTVAIVFSGCFMGRTNTTMVTPEIRAIGLPDSSIVGSVTLKVSGSDMDTVEVSYSILPSVINLAIPEGNDRTFELIVGLSPAFTASPAVTHTSFRGTATADISQDNATITLEMNAFESKLQTANPYNASGAARIVQINDMNGSNWVDLVQGDLVGWSSIFRPWDIDMDGNGAIIIANNTGTQGQIILYRIMNMTSTSFEPLALGTGSGGIAVAVDRQDKVIYYATASQLFRCDYIGSNVKSNFDMTGITTLRGMSVDDDGMLYIAHDSQVSKYNPKSGDGIIIGTYSSGLLNPQDTKFLSPYIFVSDVDTVSTNHKIVKLDMNLNYVAELPNSGSFPMWGPRKFIARRNKEIYFTDDRDFINNDKLVAMNDIDGSGWKTYGSHGYTPGLFTFAYGC